MKLTSLLENLKFEIVQGDIDKDITAVVFDSRKIVTGCLFICIEEHVTTGIRMLLKRQSKVRRQFLYRRLSHIRRTPIQHL